MLLGSVVIANDLLGYLVSYDKHEAVIKDEAGAVHTVQSSLLTEVVNPHAYSAMILLKLRNRVKQ